MSHLPILAVSDQVIVGLGTLMLVAAVLITSIIRYKADDFVKFWAAIGTVIGLALGGVGTFFFTKEKVEQKQAQVEQKQVQLEQSQSALKKSEQEKLEVGNKITQLSQFVTADWFTTKTLKDLSLALKGEKPMDQVLNDSGNTPQLYASPAPSSSPAPSISVSPSRQIEPKAEAQSSPTG